MQAEILTFIIPGMMAIFAAVLIALWRTDRSRTYVLAFAYWALAFCGGIILQGAITWNFAPYDILLFHWNAAIAIIALIWGVAKRDGQRSPVVAMLALTALTTPILYFARIYEVQSVLLMTQNFNTGLLFALAAQAKWKIAPRNIGDSAILGVFLALAGYAVLRPSVTVLAQTQMSMAQYQDSVFASLNIVISALLALMLALSLIAMVALDNMRRDREVAVTDALSNLRSRAAFESEVKAMLARALHTDTPVSLIVADIDHFKKVNDTFGHTAGDRVIARFGEVVLGKIRATDLSGRIGGEEFCIAVWDCDAASAARLADRIRIAVLDCKRATDTSLQGFTVSFGVAEALPGEHYAALFERADHALYDAKNAGRNRVAMDSMRPASAARAASQTSDPVDGTRVVSFAPRPAEQFS